MRPGDAVIWTSGAIGLTGTLVGIGPVDLVSVSTREGVFYEHPINLISVDLADTKQVMRMNEWQESHK